MRGIAIFAVAVGSVALPSLVSAIELGQFITVDGAVRGIVQQARYKNATNKDDEKLDRETRGATIVDLEIDVSLTSHDTVWARSRFAGGNALNDVGGIELPPYNGPYRAAGRRKDPKGQPPDVRMHGLGIFCIE